MHLIQHEFNLIIIIINFFIIVRSAFIWKSAFTFSFLLPKLIMHAESLVRHLLRPNSLTYTMP